MKILVACEESQAVTIELRKLGHEAYSCDIMECSGGHPEWHIKGDVIKILNGDCFLNTQDDKLYRVKGEWDMIIAFPPCTYMSNAGACRMYPTKGIVDQERLKKGIEAKDFFMAFKNAKCNKIVIENPRPLKIIGLPKEDQRIQPYMFGDTFTKMTYLWIKNLPLLQETNNVKTEAVPFVNAGSFSSNGERRKKQGVKYSAKARSKTFPGIAKAMASQWSEEV